MSRREHSMPHQSGYTVRGRGRCLRAIWVFWKFLTSFTLCIVSHVTLISLVVAYCVGGAALFEKLEAKNEIEVKRGISKLRKNVSDFIWDITDKTEYLREENWTTEVEKRLAFFETEILSAMKSQGWDGNENEDQLQWTFHGALFYSIIVITTIGYGHIAPRTDWGKVTTIFYAIIGIPLMLLCLSNIGDVMATSFRFLYWRVCCYACTRRPKRSRNRSTSRFRYSQRYSRSQPPSTALRRSIRASQRSADSGFVTYEPPGGLFHAYSDPELRMSNYDDVPRGGRRFNEDDEDMYRRRSGRGGDRRMERECPRDRRNDYRDYRDNGDNMDYDVERQPSQTNRQRFNNRQQQRERMRDRHTVERERNLSRGDSFNTPSGGNKRQLSSRSIRCGSVGREIYSSTMPSPKHHNRSKSQPNTPKSRAKSVDPRSMHYDDVDDEIARKTPILCNRWAIDEMDRRECRTINEREHKRRSVGDDRYERNSGCGGGSGGGSPRYKSVPPRHYNSQSDHQSNYRDRNDDKYESKQRYGPRLNVPDNVGGLRRDYDGNSQRRRNIDRDPNYQSQQQRSCRNSRYDDYYDDEGDEDIEMQPIRNRPRMNRRPTITAAPLPPSPRIMSPMGFAVHRQQQVRTKPIYTDDDSWYDDDGGCANENDSDMEQLNRPVPIWLCVFLVFSYIIAGAFLFSSWEKWSFLDSAYFCFITLTTIGFGDFVPAQGVKESSKESIALCSLYLLFGIALLAMSFNLVQEEVIANVKEIARRLGILKEQEPIDD